MGPLCAEQEVENLKTCTFRNSGTPVRRTKRQTSQKMHVHNFWDSSAQNKTPEISTLVLSYIMGLLCAEQNVRNLEKCTLINYGTPVRTTRRQKSQKMHLQEIWDSCAQNKTSEISTKIHFQEFWDSSAQNNVLSGIPGLLCAEQNVGNLKNCTFKKYRTPVRRTRRRKSKTK